MHRDQLIVQVIFQIFCPSEFHLNLTAHQPDLISLVLTIISQHQTSHPTSKAVAQTEPEGNRTKPVITAEKVITSANMRERNSKFTDRSCTIVK